MSSHTHAAASREIDARIKELRDMDDWRGEILARIRTLIKQADPEVVEEIKWRKPTNPLGVPVWSHPCGERGERGGAGIICTGELYKNKIKLTFPHGASLKDPAHLFNAGLQGNTRRAIDLHKGDTLNEKAFKTLVREAVKQSQ